MVTTIVHLIRYVSFQWGGGTGVTWKKTYSLMHFVYWYTKNVSISTSNGAVASLEGGRPYWMDPDVNKSHAMVSKYYYVIWLNNSVLISSNIWSLYMAHVYLMDKKLLLDSPATSPCRFVSPATFVYLMAAKGAWRLMVRIPWFVLTAINCFFCGLHYVNFRVNFYL